MIGNWRWNAIAGAAGALLILLVSFSSNPYSTTMYRIAISFTVFFIVTFAVRWMIGQALAPPLSGATDERAAEGDDEAGKGRAIDLTTPEDSGGDPDFNPLTPPRYATNSAPETVEHHDPEMLAKAIRHMSDKESS